MKLRSAIAVLSLVIVPIALDAAPSLDIEGVRLGMSKKDVLEIKGAEVVEGKVIVASDAGTRINVEFDARGTVRRIYAEFRKGFFPLKKYTDAYGKPVKRKEGGSLFYVFETPEAKITLEKVTGYPGFYIEAAKK